MTETELQTRIDAMIEAEYEALGIDPTVPGVQVSQGRL